MAGRDGRASGGRGNRERLGDLNEPRPDTINARDVENLLEDLRIEYGDLWSKWYEDGAPSRFAALQRRANDLGMLASAGAPWDKKAVSRWEQFVDSELSREDTACPTPTE